MNKLIEKFLYSFGINLSFYRLSRELDLLKKNLPQSFYQRDVIDLGCGNGFVSLKIKEIINPKSFKGVDLSQVLIHSAVKRGLKAKVLDVENEHICGDLGILWGVMHHFKNPAKGLKKIKQNFKSLIIRESINKKRIFEIAHRFDKKDLMRILSRTGIDLDKRKIVKSEKTKALIIFVNILKI